MKRGDERDSSWQHESDQSQAPCEASASQRAGSPLVLAVVRVLLSLLVLLVVVLLLAPKLLQLTATSARTGRQMTVHIMSTETRSQSCIVRACVCVCEEA